MRNSVGYSHTLCNGCRDSWKSIFFFKIVLIDTDVSDLSVPSATSLLSLERKLLFLSEYRRIGHAGETRSVNKSA